MAARLQRKMQLAAESVVRDALQEAADGLAGDQAGLQGRAEVVATRLRQRCCGELGLHVEISVPAPESSVRPSYATDTLVAVVSLGVVVGAARIVHGLLMWVGVPTLVAQLIALAIGLGVAVVAVGATVHRNARQRTTQQWANYFAHLRRRWTQSAEVTVHEVIGIRGQGQRIEQLAEYTGTLARQL